MSNKTQDQIQALEQELMKTPARMYSIYPDERTVVKTLHIPVQNIFEYKIAVGKDGFRVGVVVEDGDNAYAISVSNNEMKVTSVKTMGNVSVEIKIKRVEVWCCHGGEMKIFIELDNIGGES